MPSQCYINCREISRVYIQLSINVAHKVQISKLKVTNAFREKYSELFG